MGVTLILSTLYMWWTSVPYFPLGHPEIRGWLVLRALFGFMGLFTLYCEPDPMRPTRRDNYAVEN